MFQLLLSLTSTAAIAASAPPQDAALVKASDSASKEKVCKRVRVTGTRVKTRKMCMTQFEWDELERQSQEEFNRSNGPTAQERPTGPG